MLFLKVEQPFPSHNRGQIEFGPGNMLYIALGEGGSNDDPQGHGQDATTLLGSILRVDVLDQLAPSYRIPADNPFAQHATSRPEIWHYGFRNPRRFSFDVNGGFMFIADMGETRWEEINACPSREEARISAGACSRGPSASLRISAWRKVHAFRSQYMAVAMGARLRADTYIVETRSLLSATDISTRTTAAAGYARSNFRPTASQETLSSSPSRAPAT